MAADRRDRFIRGADADRDLDILRIGQPELFQTIDLMTFDHGETEIWVAK